MSYGYYRRGVKRRYGGGRKPGPTKRRRIMFRRKRRVFRRRRFARRFKKRSPLARQFKRVQLRFFRTNPGIIATVPGNRSVLWNYQLSIKNFSSQPGFEQFMRNSGVEFKQVKIQSVQLHWYVNNPGQTFNTNDARLFQHKRYDIDMDGIITEDSIKIAMNTKFKIIDKSRLYKQTLNPRYPETHYMKDAGTPSGAWNNWRSAKHDNPWWDADLISTYLSKFPDSSNGYSFLWTNTDQDPITIKGWYTIILKYKRMNLYKTRVKLVSPPGN